MKAMFVLLIAGLATTPVVAQDQPEEPTIIVSGTAEVETPPDRVSLTFELRGEGVTADAATTALVAKRLATEGAIGSVLGRDASYETGDMAVREVRDRACEGGGYGQPRLSTGACAVIGHLATLAVTVRTTAVAKVGTALGLVARTGGSNAQLQGYRLADPTAAIREATARALAVAKLQAEAIAAGSSVRLGRIMRVQDGRQGALAFQTAGNRKRAIADDIGPMPPVVVDLTPRPITTIANVTVTYAIAP